jgi:hypothetical protein
MHTTAQNNLNRLFTSIASSIEGSGTLSGAILDYIEATLFSPDPDALAVFLADETDCDRDSLLDLIFFPDHRVQIGMEAMLEASCFSEDDETALHRRLDDEPVYSEIKMPDGHALVRILVPDFIKTQYLKRLNITWHIDPGVSAAIEKGTSAKLATIARVRLRNANMKFSPESIRFLCLFFERMPDSDGDYLPCLELVIPILEAAQDKTDGYELLADRKRRLFRGLQQIDRFETLLSKSNMETLMLQGIRAPQASREDLVNQMRRIDRICFHLFGKTEIIASPIEATIQQISDLDTPAAAVKSLMK